MRYESDRDVELRLRGSVVMYEGRPVYVTDVLSKDKVRVSDLITEEQKDVAVRHLNMEPEALKLGYVLSENKLYFVQRRPCRKFKQGLTKDNVFTFDALDKPDDKTMRKYLTGEGAFRPHVNVFGSSFGKALLGNYPTVEQAFQAVRNGKLKAAPFDREWAVADKDEELCLLFRGDVVGYVGDRSVKLNREHFYLKESLESCLK